MYDFDFRILFWWGLFLGVVGCVVLGLVGWALWELVLQHINLSWK